MKPITVWHNRELIGVCRQIQRELNVQPLIWESLLGERWIVAIDRNDLPSNGGFPVREFREPLNKVNRKEYTPIVNRQSFIVMFDSAPSNNELAANISGAIRSEWWIVNNCPKRWSI